VTRVAFLGTPAAAVPVLGALADLGSVEAVFANPDRPHGRGRHAEPPPVKAAALERGLAVHQPERWKDPGTRADWEALGIEVAVVVAYGHILPTWMLDSCPLGAWNLHFSLLPRWRGAAPVNHALLAGDGEAGVSLMGITPGLDAGPVLASCARPILDTDTAPILLEALAQDAAGLLARHWPSILDGSARPVPQDDTRATTASKLDRTMSVLDPALDAAALHRRIRALQPWPVVEFRAGEVLLKIWGAGRRRPTDRPPGTLSWDRQGAWLAAGDGQALELTHLQRAGKPIQPALQALQSLGPSGRLLAT
jgi:methionyl-tRNA formyltransferase